MSTQSTLAFPATDKENVSKSPNKNPRKRTITTANGEDVDLTQQFAASATIIEAMRQRIFQLEDQLEASKLEPPAKRARNTAAADLEVPAPAAPSAAALKAEEKKRKMQVKKIFDRLKKECKADTCKFQGSPKTIKIDEVLEVSEFDTLFSGKGVLIQPTPQNKPTSTVTIIRFSASQAMELFGDEYKGLKGNSWTRGGGPSFSKSVKLGQVDVDIDSIEVNYSKNTMKCSLKVDVSSEAGCYSGPSNRKSFGRMFF